MKKNVLIIYPHKSVQDINKTKSLYCFTYCKKIFTDCRLCFQKKVPILQVCI